jgi:hypothetical protein
MTPHKISRSRDREPQPLRSRRFERLCEELRSLAAVTGFTAAGSLQTRSFECSRRNNCACHGNPAKRHGPYHYWTRKVGGRLVSTNLTEEQLAFVRESIDNGRRLERLAKEMRDESLRAIAEICATEKRARPRAK